MAYKPDPVPGGFPQPLDDHSSMGRIAASLKLPTRVSGLKHPLGLHP